MPTTNTYKELNTIQTGIKDNLVSDSDMLQYALFLGGVNVTRDSLAQYDPLKTGYGRLFCISGPKFVEIGIQSKWNKFKHILEYGNTAISGLNDISMNFAQVSGGYAGRSFEIPTHMTDDTTTFTVTCYEFAGSPIRQVVHFWLNGIADTLTGLMHYNGVDNVAYSQKNQSAEFIYVSTDQTGEHVEYACLLCNCVPTTIKNDHWNYTSGTHELVEYAIEFTCTRYESIQINAVAQSLVNRYRVITNSMNMYSGYSANDEEVGAALDGDGSFGYNPMTGKLDSDYHTKDTIKPRNMPKPIASEPQWSDPFWSKRDTLTNEIVYTNEPDHTAQTTGAASINQGNSVV